MISDGGEPNSCIWGRERVRKLAHVWVVVAMEKKISEGRSDSC